MSTPVSMEGDNIEPANIEIERQDDHLHSYIGSQPMNENNTHNDDNEIDEEVEKWTNENQVDDIEEVEDFIGRNKRKKRSKAIKNACERDRRTLLRAVFIILIGKVEIEEFEEYGISTYQT
ncbi:hypothetical protein KFK09_023024 [Dendrobium nobile]|uniref:Uncharacterized protein n=1 Tax=Dendrobium nobile TaxID=94219 RepID=A0A8T3AKR2_DENNO|nr:hypothetical protein KFK09_023024 [Dendrobium nobile]